MGISNLMKAIAILFCASILLPLFAARADNLPPIADVHLHYHWAHEEVLTIDDAIKRLKKNNVVLAVISTTPPENALEFRKQAGNWVVPLFRPYLQPGQRHHWYRDPKVLAAARKGLSSGKYKGIGEFHMISGLGINRKNRILHGLLKLGQEYDVPISIHTEASSHKYFLPLCRQYPRVRFLWAHAGGILSAKQVGALMQRCPNVWVEFSARDNWRYLQTPITDKQGSLLEDWRKLVLKYPKRFMVGSDPVYPVDNLYYWSGEDSGWDKLGDFLGYHRRWLKGLPRPVEQRLRLRNAQYFFRNKGRRIK
ncbi:MAG: hypothetical protein BMS9Abin11_0815 [Gammaproteobacteria bacterium]|nr:MAG: hypothetical protein BMS9Abin11_0815 [Gammaproteobacteria bacterium]